MFKIFSIFHVEKFHFVLLNVHAFVHNTCISHSNKILHIMTNIKFINILYFAEF